MPPRVVKQTNSRAVTRIPPASRPGATALDRIVPVAEHVGGGVKINLYGRNGTGKTTLACTFPKPLLLIGCEDGTKSVRAVKGVNFVRAVRTADLFELAPHAAANYATVVLDTATSLQDLVLKELLNLEDVPVQLAWGTVSQAQYRQRSEKTKELLRLFLDLSIHVVILAQEKNHSEQDGEGGGDNEILTPFVAASLGKSTCGWLCENVDYICQTFTREEVVQKPTKVGEKTVTTSRKTGRVEFCLRTQRAHPVYAAKVRADKTLDLPEVLVDPSYDKLAVFVGEE